jgi:hypothetical protein
MDSIEITSDQFYVTKYIKLTEWWVKHLLETLQWKKVECKPDTEKKSITITIGKEEFQLKISMNDSFVDGSTLWNYIKVFINIDSTLKLSKEKKYKEMIGTWFAVTHSA